MSACSICGKPWVKWDAVSVLHMVPAMFGWAAACEDMCELDPGSDTAYGRVIEGIYHTYDFGIRELDKYGYSRGDFDENPA